MAGKIRKRLGKGEYWIVNLFVSMTMMVCFVTGLMATNVFAPEMIPVIIVGCILVMLLILGTVLYQRVKKVKTGPEYEDERSDLCSMKATRNAFIVSLVFLSLYMILGQMKPDSLYRIQALQTVFGVSVAAYVLSYFYYQRVN